MNRFFSRYIVAATLLATGAMALSLVPSAHADAVYTYTGNTYNNCVGSYVPTCSSDALTGSFTVSDAVASELESGVSSFSFTPESFTFTDGMTTLTSAESDLAACDTVDGCDTIFEFFTTDASGAVDQWDIQVADASSNPIFQTENVPPTAGDKTIGNEDNSGSVLDNPGTWQYPTSGSDNTPVPEPSSYAMLGAGLLALAGLAVRKRQLV